MKVKIFLLIFSLTVVYLFIFGAQHVCPFFKNKLGCYDGNLSVRFKVLGLDNSRNYLKGLYDHGNLSQGQCHTLGHKLGQMAANSGTGMMEAMEDNSSFCGWAFFHGVMEGLFGTGAGHGKISVAEATKVCEEAEYKNNIEIFNCFHALGHGFYSLDYDMNNSFSRCDVTGEEDRRGFCYDGIFMAATFPREGPQANETKVAPLFLCGQLSGSRKEYCYWRLLPIKVFKKELELPAFEEVVRISHEIPAEYRSIFWNGFGRELDSRFQSDKEIIKSSCHWGGEYSLSCAEGAGMHMIFYDKGSTVRAESLCGALDSSSKCIDVIRAKPYPVF